MSHEIGEYPKNLAKKNICTMFLLPFPPLVSASLLIGPGFKECSFFSILVNFNGLIFKRAQHTVCDFLVLLMALDSLGQVPHFCSVLFCQALIHNFISGSIMQ